MHGGRLWAWVLCRGIALRGEKVLLERVLASGVGEREFRVLGQVQAQGAH